jgi:uncharacterized protein
MEQGGNLLHNLILFGRLLRGLGMDVNTGRMIDLANSLKHIQIMHKPDFYFTLRGLLVHQREEIPLFDEAFKAFWRSHEEGWVTVDFPALSRHGRKQRPLIIPPPLRSPEKSKNPGQGQSKDPDDEQPIILATKTYNFQEVLRRKDFSELTSEEMEAIKQLISKLSWQLGLRRTRRLRAGSGISLDLRRTLRNNLKYGGEVLEWPKREPKKKPRPLVIIADISGSMERYTRLLLHFIYTLARGMDQKVEAFVFGTRLTHVTRQLADKDIDRSLKKISHLVKDWSGGTRIGECLKMFNFRWGRRVLGQGAVVLLISDGWDRGETDLLRAEIARLQRSCYRLIWLNPLLGSEQYKPLTRGMQTALPYVDNFLPVHNLASLEDLAMHLTRIDQSRPMRRQIVKSVI